MNKLAQVAKDLQIRKLMENIRMGNLLQPSNDHLNNDDNPNENVDENKDNQTENECDGRNIKDMDDEIINIEVPDIDALGSGKQFYKCGGCEASYKHMGTLMQHESRKHFNFNFKCISEPNIHVLQL